MNDGSAMEDTDTFECCFRKTVGEMRIEIEHHPI